MFSMSWCSLTVISTGSPAYPRHEFGQLISVLPHCLGPAPVRKCKAEQRIPICSTQRNTDSVNKIVTAWALPLGIYFIFLHLRYEYDVLIQPITSCTGLEDAHSSWYAIVHRGETLHGCLPSLCFRTVPLHTEVHFPTEIALALGIGHRENECTNETQWWQVRVVL